MFSIIILCYYKQIQYFKNHYTNPELLFTQQVGTGISDKLQARMSCPVYLICEGISVCHTGRIGFDHVQW